MLRYIAFFAAAFVLLSIAARLLSFLLTFNPAWAHFPVVLALCLLCAWRFVAEQHRQPVLKERRQFAFGCTMVILAVLALESTVQTAQQWAQIRPQLDGQPESIALGMLIAYAVLLVGIMVFVDYAIIRWCFGRATRYLSGEQNPS